jgi:hypothetical protein
MESIAAARSILGYSEDPAAALEGRQLISFESQELEEQGVFTYISENFADFLRYIKLLEPKDQELLLAYYGCHCTQNQIAAILHSTQTLVSFNLRAAVRCLIAFMMFGGTQPNAATLEPVLRTANAILVEFDDKKVLPFADVLVDYLRLKSFTDVAWKYKLPVPSIRRTFSQLSKKWRDEHNPVAIQALGWFVFKTIDKKSPRGVGASLRERKKAGNVVRCDPDIVANFHIRVEDPNFSAIFQPKGNL